MAEVKRKYLIEEDFEYKGYRCAVIGQQLGHRCGYVGLPKGHRYYGEHYNNIPVDCHGGLTFGRECEDYPVITDEPLWWIGFDCGHFDDSKDYELLGHLGITKETDPYLFYGIFDGGHIWTKEEVIREVKGIVDQLYMPQVE